MQLLALLRWLGGGCRTTQMMIVQLCVQKVPIIRQLGQGIGMQGASLENLCLMWVLTGRGDGWVLSCGAQDKSTACTLRVRICVRGPQVVHWCAFVLTTMCDLTCRPRLLLQHPGRTAGAGRQLAVVLGPAADAGYAGPKH